MRSSIRPLISLLACVAALATASAAQADVLEIGAAGAQWKAGGPGGVAATDIGALPDLAAAEALAAVEPAPSLEIESQAFTGVADHAGPDEWRARVSELAAKYDISPSLLEAVVWQESRWNPSAVSHAGARGLAQLMPGTARMMGVDPDDPWQNLEGGARYLRLQLDAFSGDIELALAAYNAGPGRVIAAGGIPNIRETQQYVSAILGRLSQPVRE